MPTYKVTYSETFIYEIELEASDSEEALEEALLNYLDGVEDIPDAIDNETNIEDIMEVEA